MRARMITYGMLLIAAVITVVPFCYLVTASLKQNADFFQSLFLPTGDGLFGIAWSRLTFHHFVRLFTEMSFFHNIVNSCFLATVTSVLATICSAMAGFALAKYQFRGNSALTAVVMIALIIPGSLLLAPAYQMLYWLHMLDSYAGLIIPAMAPAFGVYLFRQAVIGSVPDALLEAARIDGCSEFRIFFTMVLPMIRPMLGAFLLITFLGTWNNYIGPQIVLQSPEKAPLAVAVSQLKGTYAQDYGLIMSGTLVSIMLVLGLFLMLQREFIAGLTAGAVKG